MKTSIEVGTSMRELNANLLFYSKLFVRTITNYALLL